MQKQIEQKMSKSLHTTKTLVDWLDLSFNKLIVNTKLI